MPTTKKKELKKKRKVGRPTSMTKEVVEKLMEAFKLDATVEEACYYAEINKTTYYAELKRNPNFSTKIEGARNYLKLAARRTIGKHIDDPAMARWFAERKINQEFGREDKLKVAGEFTVKEFYDSVIDPAFKKRQSDKQRGATEPTELPPAPAPEGSSGEPSEVPSASGGEEVREELAGSVSSRQDPDSS